MEKIIIDWALSHDSPTDWDIWNLWVPIPTPKWKYISKFNQSKDSKITSSACTMVWAVREYCYMNWIEFSISLMEDVVKYAEKNMLYKIWQWWNSSFWMEAARKYFWKWNYARVWYDEPDLALIYKNKCALWITYRWNRAWNVDSSDWELSWDRYENTTYWHRTTSVLYDKICIDDSYNWTEWNIYSIPYIIRLVNWINIYPTFYLWIPQVNKEDEVKELQRIISWYDTIINSMLSQYKVYRDIDVKNNTMIYSQIRKDLLAEVWKKRREREVYVELLKRTQK